MLQRMESIFKGGPPTVFVVEGFEQADEMGCSSH